MSKLTFLTVLERGLVALGLVFATIAFALYLLTVV